MLHGPDGKTVSRMSWDRFKAYQRWDEFPERESNPPMTTDFAFWYKNKKYYCTGEDYGNVIVDESWNRMAYDKNFLKLLEYPLFEGKSFRDCMDEILIIE
ncbi:MAG: hypothetical protein HUJ72_10540 [Blautia sp.]|nr:hypothetical protein [Blautia sp.]